jgi:hypothetical protein
MVNFGVRSEPENAVKILIIEYAELFLTTETIVRQDMSHQRLCCVVAQAAGADSMPRRGIYYADGCSHAMVLKATFHSGGSCREPVRRDTSMLG